MHLFAKFLIFSLALFFSFEMQAEDNPDGVIVIANMASPPSEINKQEIKNIFMGGRTQYDLTPVALPPNTKSRVLFNTLIVGLTEARIQSYWAQMRFSGRMKPPLALKNEQAILDYVTNNENSIAYISHDTDLPEELVVLYDTTLD